VLGVTGLGDTLAAARERAYAMLGSLRFEGMFYRNDIGARSLGAASPGRSS
jgi:phosphoribosylamine--glycine ligase